VIPITILMLSSMLVAGAGAAPSADNPKSPDAVLTAMEAYYEAHWRDLQDYQSQRLYFARHKLLKDPAQVWVQEHYRPDEQEFQVTGRRGSKIIERKVFRPMFVAEALNNQPSRRQAVDIHRWNYGFAFVEYDSEREAWVFEIEPLTDNKYLFRGRIWVDADSFGVKRIEGEPAQKPSWLVRKVRFVHEYENIDGFWMPVRHRSEAKLLFAGTATFGIDYYDYRIGLGES